MTQSLRLFLSTEHACGYLPGLLARSAFVDPDAGLGAAHYQRLLELGFRRSGDHTYRPHCRECARCVPVRIDAQQFRADRSQRRCQRDNADLQMTIERRLTDEHYALYREYLQTRHAGGGMDPHDRKAFHAFLECSWLDVRFWCFRAAGKLLAVAVVDHLPQALSAVYTFFDPGARDRGLGTLAILEQIRIARVTGLDHVYLGYWVDGSRKMDYKRRYHPLEALQGVQWRELEEAAAAPK
ncbi:arginyltransferase [Solimonas marina]|uniref:Aspartate/glutamate leucyltransferase n=1 Tax=Solimonas marina TaxID=2714601 RepID=A0A970B671_9GAMM|nr:arginyltransferase [Solimonas marina]NKF22493.1 arginyltransferase [Solimonas marina]